MYSDSAASSMMTSSTTPVHGPCEAPPTYHIRTVQALWQVQRHDRAGLARVPELTNQMTARKHVTLSPTDPPHAEQ